MKAYLTHTALLVRSAEKAAVYFKEQGYTVNETEIFEGTNTKEIYIGDISKESSLVLLMEPSGEGPYKRALNKRGESLHHLGLNVESLSEYCKVLGKAGWLLHVYSLESIPKLKTVYLVRPNIPVILEVHERVTTNKLPSLVTQVTFPEIDGLSRMLDSVSCENANFTASTETHEVIISTSKQHFTVSEIGTRKAL